MSARSLGTRLGLLALGAGLALLAVSYCLLTPLGGAPDEPSHIVSAAAAARGQVAAPLVPGPFGAWSEVVVPEYAAQVAALPNCYVSRPSVPASCSPPADESSAPAVAHTQFSRYPPLYYGLVGLPTRLSSGTAALRGARLTGLALALLAGAVAVGASAGSAARMTSLALAVTPSVLFTAGSISSSAWEIATALATWGLGLRVVRGPRPGRRLLLLWGAFGALLVGARPLSPALAVVVVGVPLLLTTKSQRRVLLRLPGARQAVALLALGFVSAAAWDVHAGAPVLLGIRPAPRPSRSAALTEVLHLTVPRLSDAVGTFAWNDVRVPVPVRVAWGVLLLALAALPGARQARWRARGAAGLVLLAAVALPVLVEVPRVPDIGLFWQVRYDLPLLVGLPLLLSVGVDDRRRRVRVALVALVLAVAFLQWDGWVVAARRFEHGITGSSPLPSYVPPFGALLPGFVLVGLGLIAVGCGAMAVRPPRPLLGGEDGPPGTSGRSASVA